MEEKVFIYWFCNYGGGAGLIPEREYKRRIK